VPSVRCRGSTPQQPDEVRSRRLVHTAVDQSSTGHGGADARERRALLSVDSTRRGPSSCFESGDADFFASAASFFATVGATMAAREMLSRVVEWIFRPAAMRAARAKLRPADDPREAAARQARLLLEVARRTAEPAEALPPGAQPAVLLGLYRDAVYWALAARRADQSPPPAELRALWDASNPEVAPISNAASPPDNEDSAALRRVLLDDYAPRALTITDKEAARARAFAEALVWDLDAPRRHVERVFVQRWLRATLAAAILVLLVFGVRALTLGADLAKGKPFRLSSQLSSWASCVANNNSCFGLMFHTEIENNPWVEIDLGAPKQIHRIEVINRSDCCEDRATPLVAEVSTDRASWTPVGRREEEFGSWKLSFPPRTARYVRLRATRHTALHLQGVAVR
jgi:hypothetical protein